MKEYEVKMYKISPEGTKSVNALILKNRQTTIKFDTYVSDGLQWNIVGQKG